MQIDVDRILALERAGDRLALQLEAWLELALSAPAGQYRIYRRSLRAIGKWRLVRNLRDGVIAIAGITSDD